MNLQQIAEKFLGISPVVQQRLIYSLIILALLFALRLIALKMLYRRSNDITRQYYWRKGITYAITLLGIFLVGRLWFQGIQSIATFFGLLAAGLAIALQDIIANIAGWVFILWRRPFDVGDRIQIATHVGDVIDQRLFMFSLMEVGNWVDADQSTGRVIHIPNSMVFKNALANYHRGFKYIWNEIPVLLTFESNWEKAKSILQEIATANSQHFSKDAERKLRSAAKRYMIFYQKLTPIVWTNVKDSGVLLTIRYLCDPRSRRSSQQAIWEDVLREFARHDDIDFAYPTTRFYDNRLEGKPGMKVSDASAAPPGKAREGERNARPNAGNKLARGGRIE